MSIPETTKGAYGPGTFTDTSFTPLPKECRRILEYLAKGTPGFTTDPALLNDVEFHGRDLPIIPGPIKAQAFVCLHILAHNTADSALVCGSTRHGRDRWTGDLRSQRQ